MYSLHITTIRFIHHQHHYRHQPNTKMDNDYYQTNRKKRQMVINYLPSSSCCSSSWLYEKKTGDIFHDSMCRNCVSNFHSLMAWNIEIKKNVEEKNFVFFSQWLIIIFILFLFTNDDVWWNKKWEEIYVWKKWIEFQF